MSNKSEVLPLEYPIELTEETIKELTIRRPTVKDMRENDKAGGTGIESGVDMLVRLSGVTADTIDMLDAADFMAASEVVEGFLETGQETGQS